MYIFINIFRYIYLNRSTKIYSYMYIHRRRDPINQLIKLKFIVITINNLPFIFVHFLAFYCKNTFSSIACSSFKFGDNCASTCTCVQANSESCNNVDGKCSCKAGYTGSNCDSGKHIPLLMGDCTIYNNMFKN